MQFEFRFNPARPSATGDCLTVAGRCVPLILVRHPRARRYVLRLRPDGSARITVPRGGSAREARAFAERNGCWILNQLHKLQAQPRRSREWLVGTEILFRGERVKLGFGNGDATAIQFGDQTVAVTDSAGNLRPHIEAHLRRAATRELPERVAHFASVHGFHFRRVTVRNQRTRWGSCSRRGTISLNWRLIQAPEHVRDYIILHELCHLREMNHSARFWREMKRVCPGFETAERWLKQHASLLQ